MPRKKRRTKEQVEKENAEIYGDVSSFINFLSFKTLKEIRDDVNSYRVSSGLNPLTMAQIKVGIKLINDEGMLRKRKEKYAYVNYK